MPIQDDAPLGYIVLIREHGRWTENWDGELHPTAEAGNASLAGARNAGYTAVLTVAMPVGPVPDDQDTTDDRPSQSLPSSGADHG